MKIDIEDIIFVFLVMSIIALFLYISSFLSSTIPSLAFLWLSITLLTGGHTYIYIKKKRDMKIEKMRYILSIFPIYILIIYLSYQDISDHIRSTNENILIFGVVFLILMLNGIVEYLLKKKKVNGKK
jgi:hypothetical protein